MYVCMQRRLALCSSLTQYPYIQPAARAANLVYALSALPSGTEEIVAISLKMFLEKKTCLASFLTQ